MEQLLAKIRSQIITVETSIQKADQALRDLKVPVAGPLSVATFSRTPFRFYTFRVKRRSRIKHSIIEGLAGVDLSYSELCRFLRLYILANGLVIEGGRFKCDDFLKAITHRDSASFFEIVSKFTSIVG